MEFSGDRSPSVPFVVTEESMRFWACPWEEVEAAEPSRLIVAAETPDSPKEKQAARSPMKRSMIGQWLMWSLMTLAYVGTISIIGYGLYEAVGHWGPKLSQTHLDASF